MEARVLEMTAWAPLALSDLAAPRAGNNLGRGRELLQADE